MPWSMLICLLFGLAVDATRGYSVEVIPAMLVHEEHLDQNGANRHRGFRMVVKEPARQNHITPGIKKLEYILYSLSIQNMVLDNKI